MNRYYGTVGYAVMVETDVDVYEEQIVERQYVGDVLKNSRRLISSNEVNDGIAVSNRISIIADPYAYHNMANIRYCTFNGVKWKVPTVDVEYPRLILDLGGVYHEQSPSE